MIRFRIVFSVVGIIVQGFALLMLIPLLSALLSKQYDSAGMFVLCSLVGLLGGQLAWRCHKEKNFDDLTRVEGMAAVAFSWMGVALVGAVPYLGFGVGVIDALFESMSGFTTTGATILKDFSILNSSMFFYRGYTQWLGGMGILVLFVAILPYLAVSGRQLFFAETSSATKEKLTPRISDTARRLWGWYFFLTVLESVILFGLGMPLNDAISNSFTTMAAGGFSPHPESIMGYKNPGVEWVIIFFMFLAGANFTLQVKGIKGNLGSFFKNPELRLYVLIIAVATVLLSLNLYASECDTGALCTVRTAMFQNISILTTTGFATVDFELWSDGAKVILLVLMFIGGCSGSAGGGIKVVRLLLMLRYLGCVLLKALHPRAVITIKLDRRTFKESEIQPIFSFVALYFAFFAICGTIAALLENNLIVGYTGAIATLGNIGPGFGVIGPMGSFADLHWLTRSIYIFLMWAGRLEIMAVAVFLRLETWRDSRW
ncbi:MAG: potassium transporter [Candidatus Riflebacteria bacterium HGW-Riflebacteria-2]|jgi:trk system potassium uptake protein TrkH|nr:MAG: potassium transporter [Candidatus Riflebacteria bacterium HGW-Riflebacteria-2]